jgi:hypothetical protein
VFFDKTTQPTGQPLLVVGRSGGADIVYAIRPDLNHLRFALDHWGVGGTVGETFEFDPNRWHAVRVLLGSPQPKGAARSIGDNECRVIFDGQVVLHGDARLYPAAKANIYGGLNTIGGSTTDSFFHG